MVLSDSSRRRSDGFTCAAACAGYTSLALMMTWPLGIHLTDRVPHDLGDPLLSVWTLWWNATHIPLSNTWWDGLAFFPARETLTLSDHRLGLGLIATVAIWLGASPIAAYNVALVLTFPLSATAAFMLCLAITRDRAAACVGGLIFGFNPYRAGHLEHLELLASYWLPVMLLALHRWLSTWRTGWLLVFSVAALLQALTSGYYFVFSGVLFVFWLGWFIPRQLPVHRYVHLGVAVAVPLAAIAPILFRYHQAHQRMGLRRTIGEIETFSADVMGLLTAPDLLTFWNSPLAWQRPEAALLPGLTAVLLVGAVTARKAWQYSGTLSGHHSRLRSLSLLIAGLMGLIALLPLFLGPIAHDFGLIRISISEPFKPLTIAILSLGLRCLTSATVRQAWCRQSVLGFYVLATLLMWVLSFGPTVTLFGHRVFYKAPYSWLMMLPGFRDEFRAPARFAMLAVLTLSVAGALAVHSWIGGRRRPFGIVVASLLAAAVISESWFNLPLRPLPEPLSIPEEVPPGAIILELPTGVFEDAAAMYRSTMHSRRTVNGLSGYHPPHYSILITALAEHRLEALTAVARHADIAIFLPLAQEADKLASGLTDRIGARSIAMTSTHRVFLLSQTDRLSQPSGHASDSRIPTHIHSNLNPADLSLMLDNNYATAWVTAEPQRGDEVMTVDLGSATGIDGISIAVGSRTTEFARDVVVATSEDAKTWQTAWSGDLAAKSVEAAIVDPLRINVLLRFSAVVARYVRVQQRGQSIYPWAVAEVRVLESP